MGVLQWLNDNIASPILKAGQWLGQKIVKPTLNFLKNVPGVGSIVQAAEPLTDVIGKTWNASATVAVENKKIAAGQKVKRQENLYPTVDELTGAVKSGFDTAKRLKGF